jgi:hypothetical protein
MGKRIGGSIEFLTSSFEKLPLVPRTKIVSIRSLKVCKVVGGQELEMPVSDWTDLIAGINR